MSIFNAKPDAAGQPAAPVANQGNTEQIQQFLEQFEDAAIQSIEDGEEAGRNGNSDLQTLCMLSSVAYSNAAIMLREKLKG
jgi:hypothetical protein